MEGLTKDLGATLLITERTIENLSDRSAYATREVARVKVKGKSTPVTLFEVMDGDDPAIVERKVAALSIFEGALRLYREQAFALMHGLWQPDAVWARFIADRLADSGGTGSDAP